MAATSDKSAFIPTGADGIKTSSQCTKCHCQESTCIFTPMSTAVGCKAFGSDTTSLWAGSWSTSTSWPWQH